MFALTSQVPKAWATLGWRSNVTVRRAVTIAQRCSEYQRGGWGQKRPRNDIQGTPSAAYPLPQEMKNPQALSLKELGEWRRRGSNQKLCRRKLLNRNRLRIPIPRCLHYVCTAVSLSVSC